MNFVDNIKSLSFSFDFDNLFTGISLLTYLKKPGYIGTDTVRENRVPNECVMLPSKETKKLHRGYLEYKSSNGGVVITRWQDNSTVTVASNVHTIFPPGNIRRYSRGEERYLSVPRPVVVAEYNKNTGGTDVMENIKQT